MKFKRFYFTEQIDKSDDYVVIYSGRFQPFHKGHFETYENLVKTFGKDKVYIGTSDKVELPNSPFDFREKLKIITSMFNVPFDKVEKVRNPFKPEEILKKFSKKTAYITALGKKDADRLGGSYFKKFTSTKNLEGYEDKGYVFVAPENTTKYKGENVSGTLVRKIFGTADNKDKESLFKSLYPRFNQSIFDLITSKIGKANEMIKVFGEPLNEGGAYGHLSHFHDVSTNTFKDMKDFVTTALQGKLDYVRLKTDGINLLVSWIDGKLRAARNKGHLKNFGKDSLDAKGVADKFQGRGGIHFAYTEAMSDLTTAIEKLTDKQREKIFANGHKWMSLEVMHPDAENIIHYGVSELRFHGTMTYDADGNVIGEDKTDGDILAGMIKQIKQNRQKTFDIKSLEAASLPKVENFSSQQREFFDMIDDIKKEYKMNDNNTINDVFKKHFTDIIDRNIKNSSDEIKNILLRRWVEFDKGADIKAIKDVIKDPKDLDWALNFDKNDVQKEWKNVSLKFELITLKMGARILKNLSNFMSVNPNAVVKKLKSDLDKTIDLVKNSKDPNLIDKLNYELKRFEEVGGLNAISPEEGITFMYKGNFYKLTGQFASANQILGLRFFI